MRLERLSLPNLITVILIVSLQLPVTGNDVKAAADNGTIRIGGTGGAYGSLTQVATSFQKKYPNVRFDFIPSLGSTGGIKAVIAGSIDLGLSSRPLTDAELHQGAVVRWIRFSWTRYWEIISDPGGPEYGKG